MYLAKESPRDDVIGRIDHTAFPIQQPPRLPVVDAGDAVKIPVQGGLLDQKLRIQNDFQCISTGLALRFQWIRAGIKHTWTMRGKN